MTGTDSSATGAHPQVDPRTLRVAELQALAASLGFANTARLRKAELVALITENTSNDDESTEKPVAPLGDGTSGDVDGASASESEQGPETDASASEQSSETDAEVALEDADVEQPTAGDSRDSEAAAEPLEPAVEVPVEEVADSLAGVQAEDADVETPSDAEAPAGAQAAAEAPVAEQSTEAPVAQQPTEAPVAEQPTEVPAPKPRARRSRRATSASVETAPIVETPAESSDAQATAGEGEDAPEPKSALAHVNHGETGITADIESAASESSPVEAPAEGQHDGTHPQGDAAEAVESGDKGEAPGAGESAEAPAEGERTGRRGRGRGRNRGGDQNSVDAAKGEQSPQAGQDQNRQGQNRQNEQGRQNDQGRQNEQGRQNDQSRQNEQGQNGRGDQAQQGQNRQNVQGDQNRQNGRGDQNEQGFEDRQERSGRSRYRDRKRGRGAQNDDFEPELSDDDVLIPVAGILDVLDNYAFVRTSGYLPGPSDVYVSLGQVKKYNLRKGDAVVGAIRQPRDNDGGRQKYNAIVKIDSINGSAVDEAAERVEFGALVPLYPQDRLRLETDAATVATRAIDLITPIGKGQRGLIVAPPRSGKTFVLQGIADAIVKNNPEVHLMVVLVDERPEEVTEMQRRVRGEVIASTFDRPAEDHTTLAELAIERAKRLVELGHDVVVLLDSITRLGRAYNTVAPPAGRGAAQATVDSTALYPPKRFFGAARNVENGGSLTILATALVETGSAADEAIFEEFAGTANMELRLSRGLADKRIFPAVDISASSTRREEMLLGAEEVEVIWKLRRALAGSDEQQALETVLDKLKETGSNVEFLMQVQKSMPTPALGGGQGR